MARGTGWSRSMPGKTARALCPVCQEPMPPDETECENCGAFVIDEAVVRLCRAFGIPREKALALFEKGFRHPTQLKNRNVDDVLQRGENGLLFLCTNCGGFVATGDPKCPRCGAEFEVGPEEPFPEKDILDITLCPVCGADNDAIWKECEICGEPLGGTEAPPGGKAIPAATAEAPPPAPPTTPLPPPEPSPAPSAEPPTLDRIDDILKELNLLGPVTPEPKVRPVAKRTKVAELSKPAPAAPPAVSVPSDDEPTRAPATTSKQVLSKAEASPLTSAVHPIARPRQASRPAGVPTPARGPSPRGAAGKAFQRRAATLPPSELTGGLTVAAVASLYLSDVLGQAYVAWGVAFVMTILAAYVFAVVVSRRGVFLRRTDGLFLLAGGMFSAAAPAVHPSVAPVLTVAGAVLLAYGTRGLLRTRSRDLIVVASEVPLIALALIAALDYAFAGSVAWTLGLVAIVPWPAAVAVEGVRQRRLGLLLGRELTKAQGHLEREQYAASVRDFDRAIALGRKGAPGEEMPWYGKGASLILLGQYEEALRAIDKALDLNPRNEVAWLNKGNALTKMGRLIDALRCFNAAIKVNPRYEVAWNNKGNTVARLGQYDEALACYERALEIDPNYRGAWVNRGYVLTKLGRYAEAAACADRALSLNEGVRTGAAHSTETSTGVPSS